MRKLKKVHASTLHDGSTYNKELANIAVEFIRCLQPTFPEIITRRFHTLLGIDVFLLFSDFSDQAAMFGRLKPFNSVQFIEETL